MERIPEPELMNGQTQAQAYARADFEGPNSQFVRLFQEAFPGLQPATIVDLGCGPADITIRFAQLFPQAAVDGVDGAANMLSFGERALSAEQLHGRVRLIEARLPQPAPPRSGGYQVVISNSLLHHLPDPFVLWQAVWDWGQRGAAVLVMDLLRPASRAEARGLVRTYAHQEPAILQEDFFNSLLAAYRPAEVRAQLQAAGLKGLQVKRVSDRHLVVEGILG